jgi:hypothetical protein
MEKLSGFRRAVSLDLTDPEQTLAVIQAEQPTHVMHLAGISVVSQANQDVRKTWDVNTQGTLNVALGIKQGVPTYRLLFAAVLKFTVAVSVRESHWEKMAALAMGSAGQPLDLQLHQALGGTQYSIDHCPILPSVLCSRNIACISWRPTRVPRRSRMPNCKLFQTSTGCLNLANSASHAMSLEKATGLVWLVVGKIVAQYLARSVGPIVSRCRSRATMRGVGP